MTAGAVAAPADPYPAPATVGRALETISEKTAQIGDLVERWESGDYTAGPELVTAARRLAGP